MANQIIGLGDWLATSPGQYLLAWEQAQFDLAVADLFGFNALQLGLPELATLQSNRMPHRWLSLPEEFGVDARPPGGALPLIQARQQVHLLADAAALPFSSGSLDLVVLPHTLELSADPHQVLREVERVLVPEGRVVIASFNPVSLWGWRQGRSRLASGLGLGAFGIATPFLPEVGQFIGPWRLRDWLRLLSFEVESDRYGLYRPPVRTDKWLQRMSWMDRVGARWWPVFGAVYFVVAVKRVRGMRLLGPAWRPRKALSGSSVPVIQRR
ncbi:MAG: methyltransferase domain-containing protein [Burkholderiales bacterium]|nr:MAG: methyltransferase domain-containing protein [Burkholderiales bacterium]